MKGGEIMQMYLVDLTSLEPSDRIAAVQRIGQEAWDTYEGYGSCGLESVKVAWDRNEDFVSSDVFPKGCRCTKVCD